MVERMAQSIVTAGNEPSCLFSRSVAHGRTTIASTCSESAIDQDSGLRTYLSCQSVCSPFSRFGTFGSSAKTWDAGVLIRGDGNRAVLDWCIHTEDGERVGKQLPDVDLHQDSTCVVCSRGAPSAH